VRAAQLGGEARQAAENKLCLSVDMDTLEDYAAVYGLDFAPSYRDLEYERVLPRCLDLLAQHRVEATFFAVARDARRPLVRQRLRAAAAAGHEIASHSLSHANAFAAMRPEQQRRELVESKAILEDVIGAAVIGFRAPAYDVTGVGLELLAEAGYRYDSSVNPNLLQPAFKLVLRLKSRCWTVGMGPLAHCFAPTQPFIWRPEGAGTEILEYPIAVFGCLRLPFFSSALQMLEKPFRAFARGHRWLARRRRFVNYQLHIAELLDLPGDRVDASYRRLAYLTLPVEQRRQFVVRAVRELAATHQSVRLCDLAAAILAAEDSA